MGKRIWLVVLGLLVIAGGAIYWYLELRPTPGARTPEGELVAVQRGSLSLDLTAGGNVRVASTATLRFKYRGRVTDVAVREGLRVAAGDTLACLETFDAQKAVGRAEAELRGAEAQLAKAEAGARTEEIAAAEASVAIAEAGVRAAEAAVQSAEAQVSSAQAAVTGAAATVEKLRAGATELEIQIAERQIELVRNELWSQQAQRDATGSSRYSDADYEAAKGRVAASESQVVIAELRLAELQAGARAEDLAVAEAQRAQAVAGLEVARGNLAQARAQVDVAHAQWQQAQAQRDLLAAGTQVEDLLVLEAQAVQARAALEEASLNLQEACLIAPYDGLVARLDIQIGDLVEASQPVLVLVDDAHYYIDLTIDEADIGRVAEDQQVDLTFDAYLDSQALGRIDYIAALPEDELGIISYKVRVDITECPVPLREGLSVSARVITDQFEDRLVVPNSAIIVDDETRQRYVIRQTAVGQEVVAIETGRYNDLMSEVVSGLAEGDLVVMRSSSYREMFREMMRGGLPGTP
ncbi:MAG: efflux RND transporter periplasmic adaptor subunit [Anaerolineae bacterium]|jgi:HlyD family secretion protein